MPIVFQALSDSSYDPISRISIPQPRVLPIEGPDGRLGREYQFALIRDGVFLDGLGCLGSESMVYTGQNREWIYTIELGQEHLLKSILGFKKLFGSVEDEGYAFVRDFSRGLVLAYAGRSDNEEKFCYLITTSTDALEKSGITIPGKSSILEDGTVVLARVSIPAHAHTS